VQIPQVDQVAVEVVVVMVEEKVVPVRQPLVLVAVVVLDTMEAVVVTTQVVAKAAAVAVVHHTPQELAQVLFQVVEHQRGTIVTLIMQMMQVGVEMVLPGLVVAQLAKMAEL
jgi:hypothetical protein